MRGRGSTPRDCGPRNHSSEPQRTSCLRGCLVEPTGAQCAVLGYYTLSASLLNTSDLPDTLVKKLPRYPQLPVILLGRLAVDGSMKGKALGQFLLTNALHRCLEAAGSIAAMAVVVDVKKATRLKPSTGISAFYRCTRNRAGCFYR